MLEDKVELIIGSWLVGCLDVDFESFLYSLSRHNEIEGADHNFPICEHRNIGNSWSRKTVKILSSKRGRGLRLNAPLFSGEVQINRLSGDRDYGGDSFRIKLVLSVNPTRFCQYQPPIPSAPPRALRDVNLFATQDRISTGDGSSYEFSLDAADNVLLTPAAKAHAVPRFWGSNLKRYIESIEECFENRLQQFAIITHGFTHARADTHYSLRSIESYFEVFDDSPITTVKQISPSFWALGNNTSESRYRVDSNISIDGYSTSLRTTLRDGEALKIYAKTNKRIRVEVTRKHYKNPTLLPGRSYTTNTMTGLLSLIRVSSQQARESALNFLEHLDRRILHPPHPSFNAWRFIASVLKAVPDSDSAHLLLDMLIGAGGGIKSSMVPPHLKPHLKTLVSSGVIEYQGKPILRYVIARRYRSVISALLGSRII